MDPVKGVMAEIELARFDKQQERIEGLYRKAVELRPGSYEARELRQANANQIDRGVPRWDQSSG